MATLAGIPVVDFSSLSLNLGDDQLDETEMKLTASELMNAFTTTGFVYLSNTHFPDQLLEQVTRVSDRFFDLPEVVKQRYEMGNAVHHGWLPSEVEGLNVERPRDLKEAFNIILAGLDDDSRWPKDEIPEFKDVIAQFFQQCCRLTRRILAVVAKGLNLENANFFNECHSTLSCLSGLSTVRLLRYPPVPPEKEIKPNQVRLGEHSDYCTMSFVFQRDTGGLQIERRDGSWVDAVPIPDAVVVNVADLLQRWTSDKLISARHRVLIPEDERQRQLIRRSIVFFVVPDKDVIVRCLDGSDKYPPVNAIEYIVQQSEPVRY